MLISDGPSEVQKKGIEIIKFLSRHLSSDNASEIWNFERLNCSRDYIRPFIGECNTVFYSTEIYYYKIEFYDLKSTDMRSKMSFEALKGLSFPL